MIDTVKIQSESIPESLARDIERSLVRRSAVDMSSGEVLYELFSGQVRDDRHHGINLRVMRTKVVSVNELRNEDPSTAGAYHSYAVLGEHKRTRTVRCAPYLWLEGSVHKAMLGHNVWGGPRELAPAVAWLCSDVSKRLGLELPESKTWDLMRADWAETYDLGSFEHVQDYVRSLNSARFPRRQPQRYGDDAISFGGRTTAVRIYHKGPEFVSEGFKKLSGLPSDELQQLVTMAHRTLRVEVSVKRPKITEYHPLSSKIRSVETHWLREIHDKSWGEKSRGNFE